MHGAVARQGWRRKRVAQSTAAELAELDVPRLADLYAELGTDYELSLDVYDPAAGKRHRRGGARRPARSTGCGCARRSRRCSRRSGRWRPTRTSCTRSGAATSTCRWSATPPGWPSSGIDVVNMHRSDWTAGLVGLFHRFEVQAFGWDAQEVRHLRELLAMGIDAVYSDHVARMVATVGEFTV